MVKEAIPNSPTTFQKNAKGATDYELPLKRIIAYFDTHIKKKPDWVNALVRYKASGYIDINKFLIGEYEVYIDPNDMTSAMKPHLKQTNQKDPSQLFDTWDKIQSTMCKNLFKSKVVPLIDTIKLLDKIIDNAPALGLRDLRVYRGMEYDVQKDLVCGPNGKWHVTFPNFLSTSFEWSVSKNFTRETGNMYTLILNPSCKGVYVHWSMSDEQAKFEDGLIDNEKELILPRGCTFELVSLKTRRVKKKKHYKDIKCEVDSPLFSKHYTLKLVSMPSTKIRASQYKSFMSGTYAKLLLGHHNLA